MSPKARVVSHHAPPKSKETEGKIIRYTNQSRESSEAKQNDWLNEHIEDA